MNCWLNFPEAMLLGLFSKEFSFNDGTVIWVSFMLFFIINKYGGFKKYGRRLEKSWLEMIEPLVNDWNSWLTTMTKLLDARDSWDAWVLLQVSKQK